MDSTLIVHTFGGFSIQYQDHMISEQDNHSRKLWSLIEYSLIQPNQEVSIHSLVDLLWPEDSGTTSPMNSFKVCLHRTRELLSSLQLPVKTVLLNKQCTLSWSKDLHYQIDCNDFEDLCLKAFASFEHQQPDFDLFQRAFQLYQGEFLAAKTVEDWVLPRTTYYHNMYIKLTESYLQLLYNKKEYDQLIQVAFQASPVEPFNEIIQYYLIQSLYNQGNSTAALSQYDYTVRLLYQDFGINPSDRLKNLYQQIIKETNSIQTDLNLIQQELHDKKSHSHAYECDYSIFRHLYQIQSRSMERSGLTFFLCLVTVKSDTTDNTKNQTSEAMDRLSSIIGSSLRSGDVYSRYSKEQFIILLPSACYENATIVGERILKKFDQQRPKLRVRVSYRLKGMEVG